MARRPIGNAKRRRGYTPLPADATACPKCGGVYGYKASDTCLDIRIAGWGDRSESSDEIKLIRQSRSAVCMECGYRFLRPGQ